ncbi:DUF2927 domain-containing protein [Stappia sp. BW2]|jgi:hypothetical protein|uniref:DUF2927 domain-containing protein n=1 Tax=Stappia sp. BW2 TaxID=2592622 RepID=UPI0011DEF0E5|nr:DUF2927 domain-containing protein [Stappia sp. BW2]TYC67736.1 DUF2927 domain-containing protein [Stappia sp. BW2]
MNFVRFLVICLLLLTGPVTFSSASSANDSFSTEELLAGFEKTVFGLEYRSWSWRPYLVKKFTKPVLFYVHNLSARDRTQTVHRFIREIGKRVGGITTKVTNDPAAANFEVYVVDRAQYEPVVKKDIYKNDRARVPGRCLVRVVSGRNGIKRSAAVIVSDEGEFLFKRCLVEELLQGLGPMNDDEQLTHSVFNDSSRHSRFTVFDQIILNMLYDPRIKPGMSMQQTRPILPLVARDARRRVR